MLLLETVIAFFLICGLVFVDDIPLFRHPVASKLIYAILLCNAYFLAETDPAIALFCGLIFVMMLCVNGKPPPEEARDERLLRE